MSPLNITQPLGIWSIMATIRWCPIYPKWDSYQPLYTHCPRFEKLSLAASTPQRNQKAAEKNWPSRGLPFAAPAWQRQTWHRRRFETGKSWGKPWEAMVFRGPKSSFVQLQFWWIPDRCAVCGTEAGVFSSSGNHVRTKYGSCCLKATT